jgi:hypothetical protein
VLSNAQRAGDFPVMMIYRTASGEGFNPLMRVALWLNAPLTLHAMSAKRRLNAYVNFLISIALLILVSLWVSGVFTVNTLSATLTAVALTAWRAVSYRATRHERIQIKEVPGACEFIVSVFTAEWLAFHCALSFYLLYMQTMTTQPFIAMTLSVLAGSSICLMLIPPAQGSIYALRTRRRCT